MNAGNLACGIQGGVAIASLRCLCFRRSFGLFLLVQLVRFCKPCTKKDILSALRGIILIVRDDTCIFHARNISIRRSDMGSSNVSFLSVTPECASSESTRRKLQMHHRQ